MNSQVLASCPCELLCRLFLVSFALSSADRALQPCVDGKRHRGSCLLHWDSDLAHIPVQACAVSHEHSSQRFPVNLACARSWVSAVGLCRAQRQFSNFLDMITPFGIILPDSHGMVMAPFSIFALSSWAWLIFSANIVKAILNSWDTVSCQVVSSLSSNFVVFAGVRCADLLTHTTVSCLLQQLDWSAKKRSPYHNPSLSASLGQPSKRVISLMKFSTRNC